MKARTLLAPLFALAAGACADLWGGDGDLYADLDDKDVAIAARLVQNTLEHAPDGTTRRWTNDASGNSGTVTPVRTYVTEQGAFCREYREELQVADRSGRFHHTACRDDEGGWVWI